MCKRLPWWTVAVALWVVVIFVALVDIVPSHTVWDAAAQASSAGMVVQGYLYYLVFLLVAILPILTYAGASFLSYHLAAEKGKIVRHVVIGPPAIFVTFWFLAACRLLF